MFFLVFAYDYTKKFVSRPGLQSYKIYIIIGSADIPVTLMLRDLLDWKEAFLTSPQGNGAALSIVDTVLRFIKIKFELFIELLQNGRRKGFFTLHSKACLKKYYPHCYNLYANSRAYFLCLMQIPSENFI